MKELVAHLAKWFLLIVSYTVFVIGCIYCNCWIKDNLLYGDKLVYATSTVTIILNILLLFNILLATFPPDDLELTSTAKLMRKAFSAKSHQDGELSIRNAASE